MSAKNLGLLITFLAVAATSIVIGSCSSPAEPEVTPGFDACAECNMVIDAVNQACGHVIDGEFIVFDSPGCLLRSHDEMRRRGLPVPTEIFLADYVSSEFIPAGRATLMLSDEIPTVMGAGVVVFVSAAEAEGHRSTDEEIVTDWMGYRLRRGQPDTIIDAHLTTTSLEPEMVEATKGDLVLLRLSADDLTEPAILSIRGYPEIGEIIVEPAAGPAELRFFATRPGAGFPVMGAGDEPLGMIRVTGAHTADEAAQ